MLNRTMAKASIIFSFLLLVVLGLGNVSNALAADRDQVKVVTVTVNEKNHVKVPELGRDDFQVTEDGVQQEVLSVSHAMRKDVGLNLAVVIQEDSPQVNSELGSLKNFIKGLPNDSQVMVVYLQGNFVKVAQPFTADLKKAADKVHVVSGSFFSTSSPY